MIEKYPDVLYSDQQVENEEQTDWDKAYALAELLINRGHVFPAEGQDVYSLAKTILRKCERDREEARASEKDGQVWKD